MAGLALATNLDRAKAFSAAAKAAHDHGFAVRHITDRQFQAKRGSVTWSLLLPPTVPYCNFLVSVLEGDDGGTEVVLERNAPWWTGVIGMRGVQASFEQLVESTEKAVAAAGGKVLGRRTF
jgi:hypothetical protein